MSEMSSSVIDSFTSFPFNTTSVFWKMKHANFQLLLWFVAPSSNVKSLNHAVPVHLPWYPPSLNPISTSSLFFELNIISIFCHSVVPVTDTDFSVVPITDICAPTPEMFSSDFTSAVFTMHVTLYGLFFSTFTFL